MAGMVHAVVVLVTLVFLMPLAALIPMPCIAAILLILVFLLNCAAKLAQKGLARKYQ